jgi:hypothetical protein
MEHIMNTVSDARNEKALLSGDQAAYVLGQAKNRNDEAKRQYLKANPDVGVIIRDGAEIWYRNVTPLHLGLTEEFAPESVL